MLAGLLHGGKSAFKMMTARQMGPSNILADLTQQTCPPLARVMQPRQISSSFGQPKSSVYPKTFVAPALQYPQQGTDVGELEDQKVIGECEWQAELANSISVIGRLGKQAEMRQTSFGPVTNFTLAVSNGKDKPPLWLDVHAWNELAIAASALNKGENIHVMGRLVTRNNNVVKEGETPKTQIKLAASNIDRIAGSQTSQPYQPQETGFGQGSQSQLPVYDPTNASQIPQFDPTAESQILPDYSQSQNQAEGSNKSYNPSDSKAAFNNQKWEEFFQQREAFWDNRDRKRNPKAPDFSHKESRKGLWLDNAPAWVHERLNSQN